MGGRERNFEAKFRIHNDMSGTVYGSVGQFGKVEGDVHIHETSANDPEQLARLTAEAMVQAAEEREALKAEEAQVEGDLEKLAEYNAEAETARAYGRAVFSAARICLLLAVAAFLTFGIITGHWLGCGVAAAVGAIALYRWIRPSPYVEDDGDDDSDGHEYGETHETWEYHESWEYWEHYEWEEDD